MLDSTYLNRLHSTIFNILLLSGVFGCRSVIECFGTWKISAGVVLPTQLQSSAPGFFINICFIMINMFSSIVTLALYKVSISHYYSLIFLRDSSRVY